MPVRVGWRDLKSSSCCRRTSHRQASSSAAVQTQQENSAAAHAKQSQRSIQLTTFGANAWQARFALSGAATACTICKQRWSHSSSLLLKWHRILERSCFAVTTQVQVVALWWPKGPDSLQTLHVPGVAIVIAHDAQAKPYWWTPGLWAS